LTRYNGYDKYSGNDNLKLIKIIGYLSHTRRKEVRGMNSMLKAIIYEAD